MQLTPLIGREREIEAGEVETALRLVGILRFYWQHSGRSSERRQWLEEALSLSDGGTTVPRAKALGGAKYLAWFVRGDLAAARSRLEKSVVSYREVGDRLGLSSMRERSRCLGAS